MWRKGSGSADGGCITLHQQRVPSYAWKLDSHSKSFYIRRPLFNLTERLLMGIISPTVQLSKSFWSSPNCPTRFCLDPFVFWVRAASGELSSRSLFAPPPPPARTLFLPKTQPPNSLSVPLVLSLARALPPSRALSPLSRAFSPLAHTLSRSRVRSPSCARTLTWWSLSPCILLH